MTADLKIKLSKDPETGEDRVPPECMRLLLEFGGHRDVCDVCGRVWHTKQGDYCATGRDLFEELLKQPEVSLQDSAGRPLPNPEANNRRFS